MQVAYKLPRRLPSEDTHVCILRLMPVTNNLSSFELREIEKFGPVPIGEFQSLKSEISE
ncbi:MAG: hypothetical protein R3A13_10045 [Bdellovibrionota bacterium]